MVIIPHNKQDSTSPPAGPGVVRFFAIVLFVVGLGMLIGMWSLQSRAQRTRDWPTTAGQVVDTRIEKHSGDDNKKYRSIVRYGYSVGGAEYTSERFSFGSNRRSKPAAEAFCAKYPPGAEVLVHYDPARPAEAVLSIEPASAATPLGIGGALVMAAGAFLFTLSFRAAPGCSPAPVAGT